MRNGDLGNFELPRMWFVVEGVVLLPNGSGDKPSAKKLRSMYTLSTFAYKRVWDLVWRYDFRVNLVTFNTDPDYVAAVQDWLDEVDFPAPLYAYTFEEFVDSIVTLPSCFAVYDANPKRAFTFGPKGALIDAHRDFDPFASHR